MVAVTSARAVGCNEPGRRYLDEVDLEQTEVCLASECRPKGVRGCVRDRPADGSTSTWRFRIPRSRGRRRRASGMLG